MLLPLSMLIVDKKSLPDAQAELRGLMISRRAAVSSSLLLGPFIQKIVLIILKIREFAFQDQSSPNAWPI